MKKRRQAIKRRSIEKIKDREYKKLYREVKKQVNVVNERLNSLERYHKVGTWSTGKLTTRLRSNKTKGLLYKGKRVRLKPRMTKTNLIQVQKATKQFLESATSTNKGITKTKESTIKSLKDTLNFRKEKRMSDRDAESLYNMLGDKQTRNLVDEIGASLLMQEIMYAARNNLSFDSFVDRLNSYMAQDMDLDLKEEAKRIYDIYVGGMSFFS